MLTTLTLLLSFVNFIILCGICIFYFKKNYVIMDKESYDLIEQFVKEYSQEELQELPGGSGFFKEYVEEDEEE